MTPFASRTSAMCVAWLALFTRGGGSSSPACAAAVLAFVRPGRRVFLGQPPPTREFPHLNVRNGSSKRHHLCRGAVPLCTLSREEASWRPQHDRPLSLPLISMSTDRGSNDATLHSSRRTIRRRDLAAPMISKDSDDASTTPAAASRTEEQTTNGAEIAVGMRVRLRDTGRLGTVVGKKAGGWWVVDLLKSWGGPEREATAMGAASGRNGNRDDDGGLGKGGPKRNESAVSSNRPISTRRLNMEPLGSAYASSSDEVSEAPTPTPTAAPSAKAAKNERQHSTMKGSGQTQGDSACAATTSDIAEGTATIAAAVAPPSLHVQSFLPVTPPAVEGGVVIHAMSAEGLAHGEMKEWVVFSDLHVSPASLDVTLQVNVLYVRSTLPCRTQRSRSAARSEEKGRGSRNYGGFRRTLTDGSECSVQFL